MISTAATVQTLDMRYRNYHLYRVYRAYLNSSHHNVSNSNKIQMHWYHFILSQTILFLYAVICLWISSPFSLVFHSYFYQLFINVRHTILCLTYNHNIWCCFSNQLPCPVVEIMLSSRARESTDGMYSTAQYVHKKNVFNFIS